ncbi:MAG: flap endonuclease-1 [Methanomicrobiales archaeon]
MGVAIRDILTEYRARVSWEELAGVAAVDAYNALYQFLTIIRQPDGTPLMDSEGRITSHFSGILFRNANFLEKGIRPVYVFDGSPPQLKEETVEARHAARDEAQRAWDEAVKRGDTEEAYKQARSASRITHSVLESSQRLLSLLGIPWLTAPSEGEAQAAHMAWSGDADHVVSQDYDALLFGAPVLARNLALSGKRRVRGRTVAVYPERLRLADILAGLGIDRQELVQIGILVGTDFNEGVRGVGPKKALKIVREGGFFETIAENQPSFDPDPIIQFFMDPPVTDDYRISFTPPDREKTREMLCEEYDFSADRVDAALARMETTAEQETLDRWF